MELNQAETNALSGLLRKRPRSSRYDSQALPLRAFEAAASPAMRQGLVFDGLVALRRGPPHAGWLVEITLKGKRAYHRARRATSFDPGEDRSTTRDEYHRGRKVARVVGMLQDDQESCGG